MPTNDQQTTGKTIGLAIILNEFSEVLIDRRLASGTFGGYWEFPGGKIEPNETIETCIKREVKEELGIEIQVGKHLITLSHTYENLQITLIAHLCRYLDGEPQTLQCQEVRWSSLQNLAQFNFPDANYQIIEALAKKLL
jgi:mutator protein MutT